MPRLEQEPPILAAAAHWKERCLINDGSVFTDYQLWTAENVDQLKRHFVDNLDYGEGGFWTKLEAQLEPASPAAKQLAAEMFWIMYLIVYRRSMRGDTKRSQIATVWEWSGEKFPSEHDLFGALLDDGMANPGQGYHSNRWREFMFFIELLRELKSYTPAERRHLLSDPWRFGSWIDDQDIARGRMLRHVLLYLLFPENFEPILVSSHKQKIVQALHAKWQLGAGPSSKQEPLKLDKGIDNLRDRLEEAYGSRTPHFYREPLRSLWKGNGGVDDQKGKGENLVAWYNATFGASTRVWAVGAGHGARAWEEFQREGLMAIGWDYLGDLSEYESLEQIRGAIAEEKGGGVNPVNDARACWEFGHEMKPGDQVIVKKGRKVLLGWGVIRSEYRHEPDRPEYDHVRDVEWKHVGQWELPDDKATGVKTITEMTGDKDWTKYAWETITGGASDDTEGTADTRYTIDDATAGLFLGREKLRGILDTLARRKNVILQGPPGVGKTFIAKRIAYLLIGYKRRDQVEAIQFHQSYAYEDFVQGWRPEAGGGFSLQNGVFHRFCERARGNPAQKYVFIIDEINRGNLSKVLGEVMMLIEADKRGDEYALPLTYSPEVRFSVPPNLYLIGLMNTADRSLAMMDYALRRRFGFVFLEPAFDEDEFANTLSEAGASADLIARIRDRMTHLNEQIRSDKDFGRGFEIGHSFFVPQGEEAQVDDDWYRSIVLEEITPLLEEYWFDSPDKVEEMTRRLLA